MNFSCDSSLFSKSIGLLASIVQTKYTYIALSGILIESKQGLLSLSAFNLNIGLKLVISPEYVESDFKILVPGTILNKLVSRIAYSSDDPVIQFKIDLNENTLLVVNNLGLISIALLDPEDFPVIPQRINQDGYIEVDLECLQSAINRTSSFTSDPSAGKFILEGINFNTKNHQLELTTTNGHTVAIASTNIENNIEITKTVSKSFLDFFSKIIKEFKSSESVFPIYFDDSQVFFELELPTIKINLSGRILDGEFPKVKTILPNKFDYTIQIGKAHLLRTLELIECVAADVGKNQQIDLIKVSIFKKECCIEYSPVMERHVKQTILLEYSDIDEDFQFGINKTYLLKHLKSLPTSSLIQLQLNTPSSPIKIKGIGEFIEEMGVIMPMQLDKMVYQ